MEKIHLSLFKSGLVKSSVLPNHVNSFPVFKDTFILHTSGITPHSFDDVTLYFN